jgi:hypothetical protein
MDRKRKILLDYRDEQIRQLKKEMNILGGACEFNKEVAMDTANLFKFTYHLVKDKIPPGDFDLIIQKWCETMNSFSKRQKQYNEIVEENTTPR